MTRTSLLLALGLVPILATSACNAADPAANGAQAVAPAASAATDQRPFTATEVSRFDQPWAMTFLPDGSLLVTEKRGKLQHLDLASGQKHEITGVPKVAYGGQGGFGDIILHPDFARNHVVYLSYAEEGTLDTRGAAVARATLTLDASGAGQLKDLKVIWRQSPKVSGEGHYGHRLAFGPDGKLWISSSERQKFDPAQDMGGNLGKIVRLNDDGSLPADNPFASQGGVAAQVWSLGHRNILGMAFDANGKLWAHEMGPAGGDELNLIEKGKNYGWPLVSFGQNYNGTPIPKPDMRPDLTMPVIYWVPVIAPGNLMFYRGTQTFPQWNGSGFISGLRTKTLNRIIFDGHGGAKTAERWDVGRSIRDVEEGPDGSLWMLEDANPGALIHVTPPAVTSN